MARPIKTIQSYPQVFLEIAALAWQQLPVPVIKLKTANAAISTRHSFNRFRHLLSDQQHPHAAAAHDLMVRIENETELHFEARGLWSPVENTIVAVEPELFIPGIDVGPDEHDKALGDILKLKPTAAGSASPTDGTQAPCEHEWDVTQTFCLKCRGPKL